jgi:hypothetical protein
LVGHVSWWLVVNMSTREQISLAASTMRLQRRRKNGGFGLCWPSLRACCSYR